MKTIVLYNESMNRYCIEYVNSLCVHQDITCMKISETTILPTLSCRLLLVNWLHIDQYNNMLELNINHYNFSKEDLLLGIINLEQLSRHGMMTGYINIYHKQISSYPRLELFDYINGNIEILKTLNIKSNLLEYQYNEDEVKKLKDFCNTPKDTDVIMVGCMSSDHRMNIYNSLKNHGINIKIMSNLWDDERDIEIAKAKVLLNIHYMPNYKYFESLRCNRWIYANKLVVSETSMDNDDYFLNKYIIIDNYDKIVEKVIETLHINGDCENIVNFDINDAHTARDKLLESLNIT